MDRWIRSAEWYRQTPFRFELCLPLSVLFVFICFFFVFVVSFLLCCVIRVCDVVFPRELFMTKKSFEWRAEAWQVTTLNRLVRKKNHHIQYSKMLPKIRYFQNACSEKAACLLHSFLILLLFFFFDKNVLFWVWGWTLNDLTLERSDMFFKVWFSISINQCQQCP